MQKKRDDSARRRAAFKSNATDEQREAQRVYERNKKKHQLANETPEQRQARLQKMREYRARTNPAEGSTDAQKVKSIPARETPQKREERLQKAREYKATYKRKSTSKEREAARERMAAIRAKRSEEQIAKDREAAKQRMANVRGRRTVDEYNEEREKQRKRPNWRHRQDDKVQEEAQAEKEYKIASGKWQLAENGRDLEAIDPENLEWDCPSGPNCRCHIIMSCPTCKKCYTGCARCGCDKKKAALESKK